jgi:hypothetical protein
VKALVDIINFNADASCLSAGSWLKAMQGGEESQFARWLKLYVRSRKRAVLGLPGATIADLAIHNPEAIKLINVHPDIFELIVRPFAHDIALLRLGDGFRLNLEYGRRIIEREFTVVKKYFLPPEFMLTNEQLALLSTEGYAGVFIKPDRFSEEIARRVPRAPYRARGLFGSELLCIPFSDNLTEAYLKSLHMYDENLWSSAVEQDPAEVSYVWRDGESSFLLPQGLEREEYWLTHERKSIKRLTIEEAKPTAVDASKNIAEPVLWYPVHSFTAWMREFRMLGFLNRISKVESGIGSLTPESLYRWLLAINSDILSAVEKNSPVVPIRTAGPGSEIVQFEIRRSERGMEGEEYLALLEVENRDGAIAGADVPHLVKWRGRMEYLRRLDREAPSVG